MENISKHISWQEAIGSYTAKKYGIDNIPNDCQLYNMKILAEKVFEPIRNFFNVPIYVPSFFRSEELNKKIGGSPTSQHMCNKGAAIDLDADRYGGVTNLDIFYYILDNLEFDQLIAEKAGNGKIEWVHVSYNKGNNRNESLIMYRDEGKTKYVVYTKEKLNELLND